MIGENIGQKPCHRQARRLPVHGARTLAMRAHRHAIPRTAPRGDEAHRHESAIRFRHREGAERVLLRKPAHGRQQRARAQRLLFDRRIKRARQYSWQRSRAILARNRVAVTFSGDLFMNARPVIDDFSSFWMPLHCQPSVQGRAAPARKRQRHVLPLDRRPRSARRLRGPVWCVNAGHCRDEIVEAVQKALSTLDFAPTFQMGHPLAFEATTKVAKLMPEGLDRTFFTNSGSESVDTALKIAIAYHRACGEGQRTRLIGVSANITAWISAGFRWDFGGRHCAEPQDVFGRAAALG